MNKGCFKKGSTPWNKDTKGVMKPNRTSFSRETLPHKATIGKPNKGDRHSGVVCTIEERHLCKDARSGKEYMHHKRVPYARYVLKQAGIEIPLGCVVYHKDGDYNNNELENLEIISRGELMKRNHEGYLTNKIEMI